MKRKHYTNPELSAARGVMLAASLGLIAWGLMFLIVLQYLG